MATDESNTATVPGRYASALFELAQGDGAVAMVEQQLNAFRALLDESEDLTRLVRSPVYSSQEQIAALTPLLERAEISGLTANFIKLLARNRRLFIVRDTVIEFSKLASAARGEVAADVASATPLTPEQQEALIERLRIAVGKDIKLNLSVDPSLLGGLVIKVGSRMIDSSLRTKLGSLKMRMKEAH